MDGFWRLLKLALLALRRDAAAGELRLLAAALVIAVASMSSVAFFIDRVRATLDQEAHQLLAADLALVSNEPITPEQFALANELKLRQARIASFNSVAVAGDSLELADVKAVDTGYPLRGQLEIAPAPASDDIAIVAGPPTATVWVDDRLLHALHVTVGDRIALGASEFTIGGVIVLEPDRAGSLFSLAPRIIMPYADLAATNLILPGSRVQYALLLAGSKEQSDVFQQRVQLLPGQRLRGVDDTRPEVNRALQRAEQFLSLAALTSVLVAGIAIALSARRFAARHFDTCAIMRSFGASQRQIAAIFGLEILLLGLGSSLIGAALGYGVHGLLLGVMSGFVSGNLEAPTLAPLGQSLATGLVAILGFALPPLLGLFSIPPARVLRRDMNPGIRGHQIIYLAAIAAIVALAPWGRGNDLVTLLALGGALASSVALALAAALLVWLLRHVRHGLGITWRYGLASIARHVGASVVQTTAIGLGMMVLLLLLVVRNELLESWLRSLPADAPNQFLVNIQPDDVPNIEAFLHARGVTRPVVYPMIRARLVEINGTPVDPGSFPDPESRRMVQREFNLSFTTELGADNRVIAGQWLDADPGRAEQFSLEAGIAHNLGVGVGDELGFQVAEQRYRGRVTSLREVAWDSFNVNFFVIGAPGLLTDLPATYITSFHVSAGERRWLTELVDHFPSVTVIDIDALLRQVRTIMDRVSLAIELVFSFTLLAGLLVLWAAIATTQDERCYDAAILKSLGASHGLLRWAAIIELATLGAVAGAIAAFGAILIAGLLARRAFEIEYTASWQLLGYGIAVSAIFIVAGGYLALRRALLQPPVSLLRLGG
ncbi:MAG: ABC transporter permease [Gammaproteobacteria bacterium]|nr:ABC transporter permease [Gammaproteobacteria bacterium]